MRKTDKPNKAPTPRTLARHFSEGKVCDYPAEIVLSAVNAYDYGYNSVTIPCKIGFEQMFRINIDAFIYLSQHRTETEFQKFLSDPNGYMALVGVELVTPFDDITPKIIVAMLDNEMFEAIKSGISGAISDLTRGRGSHLWHDRHPERYPAKFMKRCSFLLIDVGSETLRTRLEAASIPLTLLYDLSYIVEFFAEKE